MLENRFYKVSQSGGSYVVGIFFNPITSEENSWTLRDYDYEDGSRDDDDLYYQPIDEEAKKAWIHHHGGIAEGDRVMVVKGKKIPLGTVGTVEGFREIYDRYGRYVANYAIMDNGMQTNVNNVVRVIPTEHMVG